MFPKALITVAAEKVIYRKEAEAIINKKYNISNYSKLELTYYFGDEELH
ncbi:MAG: hypothetical protein ACOZCL_14575 [Bacillota bacterium]